jgi:hypothetical protein
MASLANPWAVEIMDYLQKEELSYHVSGHADQSLKDPHSGLSKLKEFKQREKWLTEL